MTARALLKNYSSEAFYETHFAYRPALIHFYLQFKPTV